MELILYYALLAAELLVVSAIVRLEYRAGSAMVLMWAASLLVYLLPSAIDPWLGVWRFHAYAAAVRLDTATLLQAHLFSTLFALCYLLARDWSRVPAPSGAAFSENVPPSWLVGLYLFLFVGFVALALATALIAFGLSGLVALNFGLVREQSNTLMLNLSRYGIAATAGIGFLLWRTERYWLFTATILLAFLSMFLGGGQRQVFLVFGAPFALYLIYSGGVARKLVFATGLIAAYGFFVFLLTLRHEGFFSEGVDYLLTAEFYGNFATDIFTAGEASLRYQYYWFIENTSVDGFGAARQIARLFLFWLPSTFAGDLKPDDYEAVLLDTIMKFSPAQVAGSAHILIYGAMWTNLAWLGVLMGGFWALVIGVFERGALILPMTIRLAVLSTFAGMSLMLFRGAFYGAFMNTLFSTILAILLLALRGDRLRWTPR